MDRRLSPGDGLIVCSLDPQRRAAFDDLQFSYPLKLIQPKRRFKSDVQCVYVIGYGGGLVAGDRVRLKVSVEEGATLVMLTQGSTKVFKTRPDRYLSNFSFTSSTSPTTQLYRLSVAPSSFLVLLPAPVTCFSRSNYLQRQAVHLADSSSSLVLLDWYTAGRVGMDDKAKGKGSEEWAFERYRSENEVWLEGRRIAKDVQLLEDESGAQAEATTDAGAPPPPPASASSADPTTPPTTTTTYTPRVAPYSCYATLFVFGPHVAPLLSAIQSTFSSLSQFAQPHPYSLVWSFSPLPGHPGGGGIARCAGVDSESVREWVVQLLGGGGIGEMVGEDLWRTAFN
ncbi:hypothetical protein JCM10207_002297 [Rhodosporidiobolus poonsookiae]